MGDFLVTLVQAKTVLNPKTSTVVPPPPPSPALAAAPPANIMFDAEADKKEEAEKKTEEVDEKAEEAKNIKPGLENSNENGEKEGYSDPTDDIPGTTAA